MASRYNHGIQRVLAKLEASINSENYYEAHQMYRTLYFRYLGQEKYAELLELLYNGSLLLLQHEQHASGADLGTLLINVLIRSQSKPSSEYFEKITHLFSLMSPFSPERETFLQLALRWSTKLTDYKTGDPELHQRIAQVFWREKNYILARQHFIHSRDGSGCAAMLVELHEQRGYSNEIDLFIAQAVLHGKLGVFTVLCDQYQISLNRDPCYRQYLDKIGQLFFNVPPPRPRNTGLFGSLLQSFFNGLDEDSDDEQRNIASTSHATQELD
ncbi:hypothetical protein M0802_004853 [Mischocyttarus mexicanus]|nr:hypothetical protein M0802_004853 [Mischocyttarus mexicanus]